MPRSVMFLHVFPDTEHSVELFTKIPAFAVPLMLFPLNVPLAQYSKRIPPATEPLMMLLDTTGLLITPPE